MESPNKHLGPYTSKPKMNSDRRSYSVNEERKSIAALENLEKGINPASIILPDSNDQDIKNIPDSLRYLNGTDYLFFKTCKKFPPEVMDFNPKRKREAWNINGRSIYYLGEGKYNGKKLFRNWFSYDVVDYTGAPLIFVEGSQLFLGLTSELTVYSHCKELLGTMSQKILSSTYLIHDCTGRLVLKMQAPCFGPCSPCIFWCCDEHFEVCMIDGVTEIGKITKFWGDEAPAYKHTLGIQFDDNVDVRVKALIFGCFFLIEYQYYKRGGNGIIFIIVFALLVGFIVGFLYADCFGACKGLLDSSPINTFSVY